MVFKVKCENLSIALMTIYQRLYNYFGPRNWWPAETPFEVIVGAILTQNVTWKNVEKAIGNLKKAELLTPEALHTADTSIIETYIRPAGFYRTKTKKLKAFVNYLWEKYDGSLAKMLSQPLKNLRKELLTIYGIGPETADAILCYAGNYPIMVMDAYTLRVFSRLGLISNKASYEELQQLFMENLPHDHYLFNEYHALIDALANKICRKNNPHCNLCPLSDLCTWPKEEKGNKKAEKGA